MPHAPLLVAEVDGQVRVALSIDDGKAIADPFFSTRDLVELLHAHADGIRRARQPRLPRRLTLRPRSAL